MLFGLRTAIGSDAVAPNQRVVLLTRKGELPLSRGYSPSDEYPVRAEQLRKFFGQTEKGSVAASIEALVAAGRDVDAIRELRLAKGISLTEAHNEVARIRNAAKKPFS